jgi:hypothetical protein
MRISTTPASDISGMRAALAHAEAVPLGQAWKPDSDCTAGSVRIVWCPEALLVRADLHDEDVFTRATEDSQILCTFGDVFEVFLEAEGAGFYTEMHVAPENFRLHLKFRQEDYDAIVAKALALEALMVRPPGFQSRFEKLPGGWAAEVLIPAAAVDPTGSISPDSRWRASFCRYDAFTDGRPPVLTSTSPYQEPVNFHARNSWRPLCF